MNKLSEKYSLPSTGSSPAASGALKKYKWSEITQDAKLKAWLPRRSKPEFLAFKSLLKSNNIEPIDVWIRSNQLIAVDGYHRLEALEQLEKEEGIIKTFQIVPHNFSSYEEVYLWMSSKQQIARRNLTPWQTTYYIGHAYETRRSRPGYKNEEGKTSEIIATEWGVNERTVRNAHLFFTGIERIMMLNEELGLNIRDQVLTGLTRAHVEALADSKIKLVDPQTIEDIKAALAKPKKKKAATKLTLSTVDKTISTFKKKPTTKSWETVKEATDKVISALNQTLDELKDQIQEGS
ncbi:MAG: hypothetical protein ABJH04_08240 [Cyclobacteriaceae bacterium]